MTEISSEPREVQIASLGVRAFGAIVDILIIVAVWGAFGIAFGEAPETGIGFKLEGAPAALTAHPSA